MKNAIRVLLILLLVLLAVPIKSFEYRPKLLSPLCMTQLKRKQGARSNMARTPEISEWEMNRDGSITGIVKFHPVIDDGDDITTSPLEDITLVGPNKLVKTKSGNAYKLVNQKDTAAKKNGVAGGGFFSIFNVPDTILQQQQQEQKNNARTLGKGKYVVVGTSKTSTSGKSRIWKAFRVDRKTGQPVGNLLTIKMSSDYDALQRESANYENLSKNIFKGAFVKKFDFFPNGEDGKSSILVIESGSANLKEWMASSRPNGLRGKEMRDAAAAAGRCLQAMHSSKLVWTDLKSENFVVVTDTKNQNLVVKGIDLESARPFGKSPVDYSPEACPPEFAQAFLEGGALDFVLTPNYDMWSLGMMLYELGTGSQYFYNKSPSAITKLLSDPSFEVDVSAIQDFQLRDLVQKCLEKDPKKRPAIRHFFLHPYFTNTNIVISTEPQETPKEVVKTPKIPNSKDPWRMPIFVKKPPSLLPPLVLPEMAEVSRFIKHAFFPSPAIEILKNKDEYALLECAVASTTTSAIQTGKMVLFAAKALLDVMTDQHVHYTAQNAAKTALECFYTKENILKSSGDTVSAAANVLEAILKSATTAEKAKDTLEAAAEVGQRLSAAVAAISLFGGKQLGKLVEFAKEKLRQQVAARREREAFELAVAEEKLRQEVAAQLEREAFELAVAEAERKAMKGKEKLEEENHAAVKLVENELAAVKLKPVRVIKLENGGPKVPLFFMQSL